MADTPAQTRYQVRLQAVADRLAQEKMANAYRLLVPPVPFLAYALTRIDHKFLSDRGGRDKTPDFRLSRHKD